MASIYWSTMIFQLMSNFLVFNELYLVLKNPFDPVGKRKFLNCFILISTLIIFPFVSYKLIQRNKMLTNYLEFCAAFLILATISVTVLITNKLC